MRKRSLRRRHRIASHICAEKRKKILSPAGNRTPVFRVTGGDTHHYTTEEVDLNGTQKDLIGAPWQLLNEKKRKKKAVPVRGIEPRPRR